MSATPPLSIAVVVPTWNRRGHLERALDSVYAQRRAADEVWVIDDGSDDGTGRFVRSRYPRASYHYQPNRGVSAARNAGIARSRSDWLAFLDSDDEWLPDKLMKQAALLERHPDHRLVHCDELWIRDGVRVNAMLKHRKSGGYLFERCLQRCLISPSAAMVQRSLMLETGAFDESLPACEDYDLWLRICAHHPVLYLDEPLLRKYGGHADQLSRRYWGMDRFRVRSLQKLLASGTLNDRQRQAAGRVLVEKCTILRNGAVKRGREGLAADCQLLIERYAEALASP